MIDHGSNKFPANLAIEISLLDLAFWKLINNHSYAILRDGLYRKGIYDISTL